MMKPRFTKDSVAVGDKLTVQRVRSLYGKQPDPIEVTVAKIGRTLIHVDGVVSWGPTAFYMDTGMERMVNGFSADHELHNEASREERTRSQLAWAALRDRHPGLVSSGRYLDAEALEELLEVLDRAEARHRA